MNIVEPAIFGAVQGLTEFLPISSSGHLLLLHSVTHFSIGDDLTFDVALHLGTLGAVIIYFWYDLWRMLRAWWRSLRRWDVVHDVDQRLAWLLIAASVPGALAGAALESKAETMFRSPLLVAMTMMVAGVVLWAADRFSIQRDEMGRLGWGRALLIGVAQAMAIVPGVSRSGATMTIGRLLRLNRQAAARFSFLMSVPILLGAVAKKWYELRHVNLTGDQQAAFVIGILTASIVGWVAIRVFLRYISRHSYSLFMWYRLAFGAVILIVLFFNR